jgi:Ser/Thr protein kinase RdoA (MazF antagonist)
MHATLEGDGTEYVATAVTFVVGDSPELPDLSAEHVQEWGRTLARLHDIASRDSATRRVVPDWLDTVLSPAAAGLPEPLAAVAQEHRDRLARLPRGRDVHGINHGDPETDNLIWRGDVATWIDIDDISLGWFAGDVCFALRDVAPLGGAPDPRHPAVAGFLRGYRDVRPLTEEEVGWRPLLSRAHAIVTMARLQPVVDDQPRPDWPPWAMRLHARIEAVAAEYTTALLACG